MVFNDSFCYFLNKRKIGERSIIEGFLRRGLTRDDLRGEGRVPVRRERLTIERMVGDISLAVFLRTVFGIGSRSQDELDERDCKLVISSMVAGVRGKRRGGGGGEWWWEHS